ncbi:MAG TPA: biotin transporter BioY [Actinomycetota bacterium]|nr:biotin transporter BioY [Actinomycetota bacterium]
MTAIAQSIGKRDTRATALASDILLVVTGSLFVAGMAQLYIRLPFTPVPITGQTLAVLLVAGAFGATRAGASLALYLGWIAIGLPFAAEGNSGLQMLKVSTASGGYLWGFVVAAVLVGWLADKGWTRDLGRAIAAMFLGMIVIYVMGVAWLSAALDAPVATPSEELRAAIGCGSGLECGFTPFVIGDVLKLLLAGVALPLTSRVAGPDRD